MKQQNDFILCEFCEFSQENYQNKIYCLYHQLPFDKDFGCIKARPKRLYKHHWSGWPGAYCIKCGEWDPMEYAIANNLYDPYKDIWVNEEEKIKYENLDKCPIKDKEL